MLPYYLRCKYFRVCFLIICAVFEYILAILEHFFGIIYDGLSTPLFGD